MNLRNIRVQINLLWTSFAEASAITAILIYLLQISFSHYSEKLIFAVSLIIFSTLFAASTVFRKYLRTKEKLNNLKNKRNGINYKSYNKIEDALRVASEYILHAQDEICVTRFCDKMIDYEHPYYQATLRKIKGVECTPIKSYKRIMKIDNLAKTDLIIRLLEDVGCESNFQIRDTNTSLYCDFLILDKKHIFFFFHDKYLSGRANTALRISGEDITREFKDMFDCIWRISEPQKIDLSSSNSTKKTIMYYKERARMVKMIDNYNFDHKMPRSSFLNNDILFLRNLN